ncbi:type II toxin-antitoxin system HicB family antitoxin [Methylobacterium sp. E-066]|uniref:type II toxin-antitoxin system HicB family antitoxin n=1 Tax=Methylobacterium sp. E-066 TaxID=2836584 RepID=UPI001FB96095|nr:type II toxin-antitoxin system HicB family antitoxin [Methylobacterium sp. E-066]MCJ2141015.1 type II toxin-antitoxin system HicB family antitoxin [Methylobacterium sp. E-066]
MVVRGYCVEVEPLSEVGAAGWLGRVPDLPGCISDGDDLVLLEANVAEAIETWISAAHRLGRDIPSPTLAPAPRP